MFDRPAMSSQALSIRDMRKHPILGVSEMPLYVAFEQA
jgi:hypothetical protein